MISGISSGSSNYGVYSASSSSSESKRIERQIEQLQKSLEEVQQNDQLDAETKAQQIELYQAQIMQLQVELTNLSLAQSTESGSGSSQTKMNAPAEGQMQTQMRPEDVFQAPPPPQSFENIINNLSDEDLTSLLKDIQEKTGSIPGQDGEVNLDELSSDDLQEIRQGMIEDMQSKMQPPPEMRRACAIASYEAFQQGILG